MAIDLNTGTTGVVLPVTVANEVWKSASEQSVVMQLARRIDIPAGGAAIPIISGTPLEGDWVAETDEKPVKKPTLDNKTISGHTIALIVPFSNQFRQSLDTLYGAIVEQLPGAIARGFDRTVFGYKTPPASDFATLDGAAEVEVDPANAYGSLLAAAGSVAAADGDLSAWVLSPTGELAVMGAVDGNGRPLFTGSANNEGMGSIGSLLGRPVYRTRHIDAGDTGFAGDWSSAVYGVLQDINIAISEHATITGVGNLFQRNMFALRCEATYAFGLRSEDHFVKLTAPAGP